MLPRSTLRAGLAYFAIVFAVAFALGSLRVLVIAPRLGPIAAVLIELPLILTTSWVTALVICRRVDVPAGRQRIVMGAIAFLLLQATELALGLTLFHQTLHVYLANILEPHGIMGFLGQMMFGVTPALLPKN